MAKAPKAAEAASPAPPVDAAPPSAPEPVDAAPPPAPEPVDAAPPPAPEPVVTRGTLDVIILQPVRHDNEDLVIGRSYTIEAKAAQALIDCGAAEEGD
ncbi:hypothetical protein [Falsiroseomonas sp.]|uniref:hypothetical protein n=1 Tax=Falsiroseomonas sp. TaxID=2870721 RepID=UPI003F719619